MKLGRLFLRLKHAVHFAQASSWRSLTREVRKLYAKSARQHRGSLRKKALERCAHHVCIIRRLRAIDIRMPRPKPKVTIAVPP